MSRLPPDWKNDRLKDRVRFAYGDSLAAEDRNEGEIKVFGSNGIVGNHDRAITNGRTIIVGRKGSFGKVTWCNEPCFPIDTTYYVDSTQTRDELRWLFYALENLGLDTVNFDSAVPGLSREVAYSLPLVFPPKPEQQRIAAYLDASCAAIDAALSAKRRQLETLAEISKTIITKAVTVGINTSAELRNSRIEWIGEIPRQWRVEKLKYLTSLIVDGTHVTPTYEREGVPFLRVTDIQDASIDLERVKYISQDEHQLLSNRAKATRGDILLSKNGTIGLVKVVNWDWEFSFFVSLCLLRPTGRLNPRYFTYFFQSSVVDQQLSESSKKTSVTNLHLVKIRELLICVPTPKEQEAIADFLDNKLADMQRIVTGIENQITTLTAYRKSLIHECVTGQRRITEADLNLVKAHG